MYDDEFIRSYRCLSGGNDMGMADKKFLLRELAAWTQGVEGAIAECGAYRGVSAWFLADASRDTDKTLHLFDSFEGLSAPGTDDGTHWSAGSLTTDQADCIRTLGTYASRAVIHKAGFQSVS